MPPQFVRGAVIPRKATDMPHPHDAHTSHSQSSSHSRLGSPVSPLQRPVVSRRRLLEGGAAVLGALALAQSSAVALPSPRAAADGTPEWNGHMDLFQVGTQPPHTTLMPYA